MSRQTVRTALTAARYGCIALGIWLVVLLFFCSGMDWAGRARLILLLGCIAGSRRIGSVLQQLERDARERRRRLARRTASRCRDSMTGQEGAIYHGR